MAVPVGFSIGALGLIGAVAGYLTTSDPSYLVLVGLAVPCVVIYGFLAIRYRR
jgi:tetrahydromethanopterin S-methyltransferase subunit C